VCIVCVIDRTESESITAALIEAGKKPPASQKTPAPAWQSATRGLLPIPELPRKFG
jgi:hypothetical protein